MKVLLLTPPTFNIIRESLPPVVEDASGTFPPLGLLYVAAYAESVPGCDVTVLDCQAEKLDYDRISQRIQQIEPDVVGIQVMTFTLIDAVNLARIIKRTVPGALVVFGGPHPTLYPFETVALDCVDAVVYGEGEYPFKKLLESVKAGRNLKNIHGIVSKNNPLPTDTSLPMSYIENLDDLKRPAWHLIDLKRYSSPMAANDSIITMMSSRGCPGKCIFCDRPQMGKRFRKRSAGNVVDEMSWCAENLDVSEIKFYDDTFSIDRRRVHDICDLIIQRGLHIKWEIRARIDTISPPLLEQLRNAGCVRIHYGVETGSARLQKRIKKNLDLNMVQQVFHATQEVGIETLGYFMIGLPTETRAELDQTISLIQSLPMDYAHIGIFTPYPGTEVYTKALQENFFKEDYWKKFAENPQPDFQPKYWTENFSEEELFVFLKKTYAGFYNRPQYILKRLLKVRSVNELLRKSIMGIKLIREVIRR